MFKMREAFYAVGVSKSSLCPYEKHHAKIVPLWESVVANFVDIQRHGFDLFFAFHLIDTKNVLKNNDTAHNEAIITFVAFASDQEIPLCWHIAVNKRWKMTRAHNKQFCMYTRLKYFIAWLRDAIRIL